jgi:FixJ family two-component response regulator
MRVARPVELNSEVRKAVERLARGRCLPARMVERARIVLRAAEGLRDKEIAQELGVTPEKVARWRNRLLDRWNRRLVERRLASGQDTHNYRQPSGAWWT